MYKVLIVDDEKLVVESLKRINVWENEGFQVIDHAYNGITAYQKIQELKPDVVFVDIRMPKMNGLELMVKANELPVVPLFVVISGNAEFAYAQKAITLGALGYCLKPFEPAEIISLLKSIKMKLDKMTDGIVEQLAELLFDPYISLDMDLDKAIGDLLCRLDFLPDSGNPLSSVTILGADVKVLLNELKASGCLTIKRSSGKATLLIKQEMSAKMLSLFRQNMDEGIIDALGISLPVTLPGELVSAVMQSEESAYSYFMYGKGNVFYYVQEKTIQMNDIMPVILESIARRDVEAIEKNLDNIAARILREKGSIRHVYLLYTGVMGGIFGKSADSEKYLLNYQQMVHYYGEFSNLISKLKEYAMDVMTPGEYKETETRSSVISAIIQHINLNFYKDINIHSIARDFYINPNYFCGLFKKTTGMTFTEYITKCRIDLACELLKNSNLSIHEISEKIGYDNVYYFNKLFKRIKGMSPSQYKSE